MGFHNEDQSLLRQWYKPIDMLNQPTRNQILVHFFYPKKKKKEEVWLTNIYYNKQKGSIVELPIYLFWQKLAESCSAFGKSRLE